MLIVVTWVVETGVVLTGVVETGVVETRCESELIVGAGLERVRWTAWYLRF